MFFLAYPHPGIYKIDKSMNEVWHSVGETTDVICSVLNLIERFLKIQDFVC